MDKQGISQNYLFTYKSPKSLVEGITSQFFYNGFCTRRIMLFCRHKCVLNIHILADLPFLCNHYTINEILKKFN